MHTTPPPPLTSSPRPRCPVSWIATVAAGAVLAVAFHVPAWLDRRVEARALAMARELCPPPIPPSAAALEAEASAMAARELAAELNARLSLLADALGAPPSHEAR